MCNIPAWCYCSECRTSLGDFRRRGGKLSASCLQSESMKMMQDAFVLTMRIQELQRQHEAITNNVAAATQGEVKQSQEVDNPTAAGGHTHGRTGDAAVSADISDPAVALTNAAQGSTALYTTQAGLLSNSACRNDQQQHKIVQNHTRGLQQQPQVPYHNQQAPAMQPQHVSHPQQPLLQHQHQQLVPQPQQYLSQQHSQQVMLQQPIIQQQQQILQ